MKISAYQNYKPSGVEWLGNIPAQWEVKRLRFIGEAVLGLTYEPGDVSDAEDGLLVLRSSNVQAGKVTFDDNVYVTKNIPNKLRTRVGDILICSRNGSRALIGKNAKIDERSAGMTFGAFMTIFRSQFSDFLYWAFNSSLFEFQSGAFLTSTINQLTVNNLYNFAIAFPPSDEQQTIARFLDAQTARIDTLVAKKRQLIAKLKEKRSALIARTVTRGLPPEAAKAAGLEPNPEMKDSGVEWLGEAPIHWEVKRLKFAFPRLFSGVSANSESAPTEEDFPGVLKTSCVYGNQFHPNENKRVLEDELDRLACPVTRDSVIISRMNTPDLVGNCGYAEYDYPNLFLPDRLWIARFENHSLMHGKFAWYLVSSYGVSQLTGSLATGTSGSMKNLSQDAFLNITVALPPTNEQQAIASFLDRETAHIDQLITKVEAAISRLTEYRQALITSAVTGKIDVRGWRADKEAA